MSEYAALEGDIDTIGKAASLVCDTLQATRMVGLVAGIKHWKCSECGTATIRLKDGTIDGIAAHKSK